MGQKPKLTRREQNLKIKRTVRKVGQGRSKQVEAEIALDLVPEPGVRAEDLLPMVPDDAAGHPGHPVAHLQEQRRRQQRFLQVIRKGGSVTQACHITPCHRSTYEAWKRDEAFTSAYEAACAERLDRLEDVANQLATGQITRPVVSAGKLVTHEAIYSERMIEFLLKSHRRNVFGDKTEVQVGGGGTPIRVKHDHAGEVVAEVTSKIVVEAMQMLADVPVPALPESHGS